MQTYGRLVLMLPQGDEQAFELAKLQVGIGRGSENDIVLDDGRVSRQHARLECGPTGCFLVDQGSVNGSYLNGGRVERAPLSPGDLIKLGNTTLRYESVVEEYTPDITMIDNMIDLEHTFAQETVALTLYDTTLPRVVVNLPGTTWEVPITTERTSIGRETGCDIVINHHKVSRQHAQIELHGVEYVIRDMGSTNGTWLGSQAISEHTLKDGNTIRIGEARLVYKAPFTIDDLTVSIPPPKSGTGSQLTPVIFVPGLMGSELWSGKERVWPNVRYLFSQPEIFTLPEQVPLEPRGIVNEVVIVPNLIKQEQYNRLGDFLVSSMGYTHGVDYFEYGYDWRRDVRDSARRLAEHVEKWNIQKPFVIMAHSLGCLVTRYYIERLGGKDVVERAIFLGGPHYGVPKAVANLILKVDLLPFGLLGDRLRNVLVTFPSLYQILPIYDSVFDQHGTPISVMKDESWIPKDNLHMLRAAYQFRKEVGPRLSIPGLSIFGYGIKTVNKVNVQRSSSGEWQKVDLVIEESGDQTIPDISTILEGSEIHPVQQYHGSLFIDNDVKMRLKLELTGLRH